MRKQEYLKFVNNLEVKATKRYQSYMKYNYISKNHRIKVDIKETANDDYTFDINVVGEFNLIENQPGGADQALRRVAIIFGLIDMTENKNGYPLIADAPISNLSSDTKKAFFESILEDAALNQSIILNMDLWSAENHELNELGRDVLKIIKNIGNSSFITLIPKTHKKGVFINYLKK